jgi:molybdopterin synthase sulfur carrier subunit
MPITVRYFASLAEDLGRREERVQAPAGATVLEVWRCAHGERALPANMLSAVNHEYVDRSHPVRDGDEVAFFPPVTGG